MSQVEAYISEQMEAQQVILMNLHRLIMSAAPQLEGKLTYGVPFYYYLKRLCYISLSPKHPERIILGLCQGAQLSNANGLLQGDQKEVRHIVMQVGEPLNQQGIMEVLQEALILQEVKWSKK